MIGDGLVTCQVGNISRPAGAGHSVHGGIERHRGEHPILPALAPQHVAPQAIGVGREHVPGQGGLRDPGVLLHLRLQLAGPPSRVAGEHPGSKDTAHSRGILVHQEPDGAERDHVHVLRVLELRQDHGGLGLHGTAQEQRVVGPHQLGERGCRVPHRGLGGAVQHHPNRAVVVVPGDQHHRSAEVRVPQVGTRDQQLPAQAVHSPHLLPMRGLRNPALHAVRSVLDPDHAVAARLVRFEEGFLSLPDHVVVDVERFEGSVAAARRARDAEAYRSALAVYRGDLLPDDPYEEWAIGRREELRRTFVAASLELAELLEARAELDEAALVLGRVIAVEPANEQAHRARMHALALAGRRHDALEQYERLREALAGELGVEPDLATVDLHERIRAGKTIGAEFRTGLWEQLGDLRHLAGDAAGAASAYAAALGDGPAVARLHRKLAYVRLMVHDAAGAEAHLDAGEALASAQEDRAELGRLAGARANWLWETGRIDHAQAAAEESLRLAESNGDAADVAAAYETLAIVFHSGGRWRDGLHVEIERMGTSADTDPQLARVFDIHHCIGQYHLYGDELFGGVEEYARRRS